MRGNSRPTIHERRVHRVFVTHHTEYHLRGDECIGVRDRETGEWLRRHPALRLRVIDVPRLGFEHQMVGKHLLFWGQGRDVHTSSIVEAGRPDLDMLDHYVSRVSHGEIDCGGVALQ